MFKTNVPPEHILEITRKFHFYHTYRLSNGLIVRGDWDIAADIDDYMLPDVRGARVLDMGPASGWFSFFLEAQGASVTALESRGYCDFDVYGVDRYSRPDSPPNRIYNGKKIWHGPHSDSFWVMHEILNSNVDFVNGRFYEAPDVLDGKFDLVLACNILQHVRDPIGVLRAAHAVCNGVCIVAHQTWEDQDDNPHPIAQYPYFHIDRISWAQPNRALFEHWFKAAGFRKVECDMFAMSTPDRENYSSEGILMNGKFKLRIAHAYV